MTHKELIRRDGSKYKKAPAVSLQYKNIELCVDLNCVCGEYSHYDGDFGQYLECFNCHRIWFLSNHPEVIEVIDPEPNLFPKLTEG